MSEDKKLYAGKYNSIEELEEGYKEVAASFDKRSNYETKFNELSDKYKVPDEYDAKGDLLDADKDFLRETAEEAKSNNLTQDQFDKFALKRYKKVKADLEKEEQRPKADEKLTTYLKDKVGMTDGLIGQLSKEDIQSFSDKRIDSLNTNTNVYNSSSTTQPVDKDALYKTFKRLDKGTDRLAADKAYQIYHDAVSKK